MFTLMHPISPHIKMIINEIVIQYIKYKHKKFICRELRKKRKVKLFGPQAMPGPGPGIY